MSKRITQEQLLKAVQNSGGIIKNVQNRLIKICGERISWDTVKSRIEKNKTAKAAFYASAEELLDDAENIIQDKIKEGDVSIAKWYLRMKGKERGYEVSTTVKVDQGEPLNINFSGEKEITKEELINAENVELGAVDVK